MKLYFTLAIAFLALSSCTKFDHGQTNEYGTWPTVTSPNGCKYYMMRNTHGNSYAPVIRSDGKFDCVGVQ